MTRLLNERFGFTVEDLERDAALHEKLAERSISRFFLALWMLQAK